MSGLKTPYDDPQEDDFFESGVSGKFFLNLAGVRPFIVENLPAEARAHRRIGVWLFIIFSFILLGLFLSYYALDIAFSSLVFGLAFLGLLIILTRTYLRYINSGTFNDKTAAGFFLPLVFVFWVMLCPAILSIQKIEFKEGVGRYKSYRQSTIRDKFLKDSTDIYDKDDSNAIRRTLSEPIKYKVGLLNSYLLTVDDTINMLNLRADSLQRSYSLNTFITRKINDSIRWVQNRLTKYNAEEIVKRNQIKEIDDSLAYIKKTYEASDYKTYTILQGYLQSRKNKVNDDIYSLRKAQIYAGDSLAALKSHLNRYLRPGIQLNQSYKNTITHLTDIAKAKADAEAQVKILSDSIDVINKSGTINQKIALLAQGRDSLLVASGNLPGNWINASRVTAFLLVEDDDFKSKFIAMSVIFILPVISLLGYALFRKNYYRRVYREYVFLQRKRTESKARSFIDLEELKYDNRDLDESLKDLKEKNASLFSMDEMKGSEKPEDYYYATALKQEEIVKQTKNTRSYDPTIVESAISNINKAINIVPDRSAFWELKSRLLFLDDQVKESQKAAEKYREFRSIELFEFNISNNIWVDEIVVEGLPFFGSFSWKLNPVMNILLGRNGYGKSHFLSIICAMLKTDDNQAGKLSRINDSNTEERFIKIYLTGNFNVNQEMVNKRKEEINALRSEMKKLSEQENGGRTSRRIAEYKEIITKKRSEIDAEEGMVMLTPTDMISKIGQVPVLAIPDMRFVNKATEYTDNSVNELLKGEEYLRNTSYHFIKQEPFESVLQNLLNILGVSYFENNRSFDAYIFKIISGVFQELTGNKFDWYDCKSDSNGSYRITVVTEGNSMPLPIQKISQGTFSVLSIVGLIYLFLKRKYSDKSDEDLVKQQAIIIIDEIDAHLHPLWQQKIVNIIRKIFNGCQFIITAHSPLVVAGCKEDEVAVMRDERDENNNITGFLVYQFKEDFIGSSVETLYNKIFQIEERDEQFMHYTAMQPFINEMTAEKERLESMRQTSTLNDTEEKKLKQISEDLYYAGKTKALQDERNTASMLESENLTLKVTVESLKRKMEELEKAQTTK